MEVELIQVFDGDVEAFEKAMDDPLVIEEQVSGIRAIKERKVTSLEEDERYRHRTVEFVLDYDLVPRPARRVLKPEHLIFKEISTYDKLEKRFDFKGVPPFLKGKLEMSGTYSLHPLEEERTRREIRAHLKFHVFAIGKVVEMFMRSHLKSTYAKEVEVLEKHLPRFRKNPV